MTDEEAEKTARDYELYTPTGLDLARAMEQADWELAQRIGKSANEFLTTEGVSAEAVFLLGKDLNSFREIAEGLQNGSTELRLPGTRDAASREALGQLLKQYEATRAQADRKSVV